MQFRKPDFYKTMHEKTGVSEDLASSICDFILKRWQEWTKHPDNLNLDIKYFGVMRLRYKKGISYYDKILKKGLDFTAKENNVFKHKWEEERWEREYRYKQCIEYLLHVRYPKYLSERGEIQKIRKDNATYMIPSELPSYMIGKKLDLDLE